MYGILCSTSDREQIDIICSIFVCHDSHSELDNLDGKKSAVALLQCYCSELISKMIFKTQTTRLEIFECTMTQIERIP